MKKSAQLINVGRGALVDETAPIDALDRGSIAGASLDVFAVEPLPESSPLWSMPQVQVSPHLSGDVVGWRNALADQFRDNLERWATGRSFPNVMDKESGYVRR